MGHKDTIKAFKHFSSPHSSLFCKSLFRRRTTTSPTKKCYLTHIQLKKSVSSICFKRHFLRQTLFDDKLFCIRQSNQRKPYHQFRKKKFEIINTELFILKKQNIIL